MSLRFEWDARKALTNQVKHGVSFDEAMSVFTDPLARIFDDPDHSVAESREIIIGLSQKQRLLVVCFTERSDTVRIFSARKATKLKRQDYEERRKS
jgi:uncharacterized DUF497 family protein